MRFAILASSLLVLLLGGAGQAAEGDGLVVTGNGVNVRARPQPGAPVLLQVQRAERAVELAREGEWVQVRLPDRDTVGWIHGSLLGAPTAAPDATAAASPQQSAGGAGAQLAAVEAPADPALARFRQSVENLNTRALAAAGVDLFADVRMAGDGVAQVTVTDSWSVVPEGGQRSYLNALFDRWTAAAGSPLARLEIVDESGQVLSERTGP